MLWLVKEMSWAMWLKDHVVLWVGFSHCMLPRCQVGVHRHCGSGYIVSLNFVAQ